MRHQMACGAIGAFALQIANAGLIFLTSLVLARILGAKGYGIYAYAISWVSILLMPAMIGQHTLLLREVARYRTQEDWDSLRGILCWSDRLVLLTSFGLALLGTAVIWFLRSSFEPEMRTSLWVAMALLPLLAFVGIRAGSLLGLGHVIKALLPKMLILPVLFLALVGILHLTIGLSPHSAVGMRTLAAGVAFLVAVSFLKRCLPGQAQRVLPNYHGRAWIKSALPLLFVEASDILNQHVSVVMLGSMVGPEVAGVFDVAMRGAMLMTSILMAVSMPLAPTVAGLYHQGERERLQRIVTRSAQVTLAGSLPIALGLIIFGRWFLSIFGKEFTTGSTALAILSLGLLVNLGMGSVALLLNMTGNELHTAKGVGVATLINVLLNATLIPIWGVEGAAVATVISMVISGALMAVWVHRKLCIHPTALGVSGPRRYNEKAKLFHFEHSTIYYKANDIITLGRSPIIEI